MKLSVWNDRLQLLASIGVIVGLAMVAYELRLSTRVAQAEAGYQLSAGFMDLAKVEMDLEFAELWVKSVEHPETLTAVDHHRLSAYMWLVVAQYDQLAMANTNDDLVIIEGWNDWETNGQDLAESYFYSAYAREWFEANKTVFLPKMREVIEAHIAENPL